MSRKRALPEGEGEALFAAALKDAKPLKGRVAVKHVAVEEIAPLERAVATPRPLARKSTAPLPELKPETRAHPDRATAEKMRRGAMAVEATLDLHGMTLARAEPALSAFLVQAQAQGKRLVLVVTGKGTKVDRDTGRIAEGAIRREFPHWLNAEKNRSRIVAFRAAHVRHGGGGAFYVLLKKLRPTS
ncbi:MAG: mismatch repair protein MutS [Alphaproteobacteria bacterium]|jgi:DNA-nicking Smr family endonuclease|nr:mismatch repair protein MutS [Alphaproteobacteria bacterium]